MLLFSTISNKQYTALPPFRIGKNFVAIHIHFHPLLTSTSQSKCVFVFLNSSHATIYSPPSLSGWGRPGIRYPHYFLSKHPAQENMMKIALTRRTEKKTHYLNYSILMKRTCQIKTVKLVPVFAARWCAICKYFINSEDKQPERWYNTTTNWRKTPHAYTQGKRNSAQPSQSHYYSHFNL